MDNKRYVFVKLSYYDCLGIRLGGAGLGNILFPWARAIVYARKHNLPLINTTWKSLKLGPLLRGEIDTRGYSNLFHESNISGLKKFLLLIMSKRISEENILLTKTTSKTNIRPNVIIFTGMKNQMADIIDDYQIVKNELLKIITTDNLQNIEKFTGKGISVHIRMGDFYIPKSEDEIRAGKTNCRLPLRWYIEIIKKIRTYLNDNIQVNVFSDGKDGELQELLDLDNVKRHFYGSAIADMMALSKSDILIASNSTFSLWASYLGQMPTIWFPGTHRYKLKLLEYELDYDDSLPDNLKEYLTRKLA